VRVCPDNKNGPLAARVAARYVKIITEAIHAPIRGVDATPILVGVTTAP
jgi:hypothetical protein